MIVCDDDDDDQYSAFYPGDHTSMPGDCCTVCPRFMRRNSDEGGLV